MMRKIFELGAFDHLVASNRITQAELTDALNEASKGPKDIETILIDKYNVPKAELGASLSDFYHCPYIAYSERTVIDPELLRNLSIDYLKKNGWIPLKRENKIIDILIDDPHDLDKGRDIKHTFPGLTIRLAVGLRRDILKFLLAATGHEDGSSISEILGELVNEAQQDSLNDISAGPIDENDSAIVRLANQIIADAYRLEASDIHIEPYSDKKETFVRLRVDGTCFKYMTIPPTYRRAIVSRFKIMAKR